MEKTYFEFGEKGRIERKESFVQLQALVSVLLKDGWAPGRYSSPKKPNRLNPEHQKKPLE
jgi:hypothetical protein